MAIIHQRKLFIALVSLIALLSTSGNSLLPTTSIAERGLHVDPGLLLLAANPARDQIVRVEINATGSAEAARIRPLVEQMGGVYRIGINHLMEFNIPVQSLPALDQIPGDYAVVLAPQAERTFGHVTSQGAIATGAPAWHALGYTGKDVQIGVIDLGFDGYDSSETAGCLRQVQNFVPDMSLSQRGDHGTNVIEIICDMAPDAHIWAAQANTTSSLSASIDWLIGQGVDIINMSMRWDSVGVGDGTGEVNDMIQGAINQGVLWVNAAGNSNGNTWDASFNGVSWDHGSSSGTYQDFDSGEGVDTVNDLFWGQTITCDTGYGVYVHAILRWSDWNDARTGNASNQDYDLYVFRSTDNGHSWEEVPAATSERPQQNNVSFTPVEEVDTMLACDRPDLHYGIAIRQQSATGAQYMQLITWISGEFEYHAINRANISTPADSADVLTIAAGDVNNNFEIASYSSRGPILGPGGTDPAGALYNKPDVTAPTNVTTSRLQAFDGTSAAAAHAAGFAALVYQHNHERYDSLTGVERSRALKSDIMDSLARPAPEDRPLDYGVGVLTTTSEYWWSTDKPIEETSGAIVRSGSGWTSQDALEASGGQYAYTASTYAQIEFGTQDATGITISYWQRPEFTGTADVYMDGVLQGSLNLHAEKAASASLTLTLPDAGDHRFDIRPTLGSAGLSLDSFQLSFPPASNDFARQATMP